MGKWETALSKAARSGHLEDVEAALAAGADVRMPARAGGEPPVVEAADKGQALVVALLLRRGAVPEEELSATLFTHRVFARILHSQKAAVLDEVLRWVEERTGDPARSRAIVYQAMMQMRWRVMAAGIRWLREHLPPLDWKFEPGARSLMQVAVGEASRPLPNQYEWVPVLEKILAEGGTKKSSPRATQQRDLRKALDAHAKAGDVGGLRALLGEGADVNTRLNSNGVTALMVAAMHGHLLAVEYLLGGGADPNIRISNGRGALDRALEGGHDAVVRSLLDAGVRLDYHDSEHRAPIHLAAEKGCSGQVIAWLVAAGADVNQPQATPVHWFEDSVRPRPLHLACRKLHLETARALLQHGADVQAVGPDGGNALHDVLGLREFLGVDRRTYITNRHQNHSARKSDIELFALLLEAGCDPSHEDREGRSPLAILDLVTNGKEHPMAPVLRAWLERKKGA